ncbi:dihydropteroate synthase [Hydrogenimonas cancrithermarum]|uniref:dihydropteroate synthase n=1 Tax=Hydrogenimonas cancrithermarum TaxID=2993563 RepID=A0ABN6WTE1_9BACT|nr:dihydropteroate synthase [Hydrogenimonas cancrithermarum]BDY12251.1 dihydropteroate synthase [Hydrogenimonas cancrithermarum]
MKIYRIDTPLEKKKLLKQLECDKSGVAIMSKKMETLLFVIKDMPVGAANILKQDALALGAELAVPTGVVTCSQTHYDAVLMGTPRQLGYLVRKEKAQPFGLKKLAKELESFLHESRHMTKIMGVVNANDDSFYPGSRYKERTAVEAIWKMIEEGADIIDVGGVSSRPGSEPVGADEELKRLVPIVDTIRREKLFERARFSIDSYTPEVVAYALENGFSIVNDITGLRDERLGVLAKSYGAAYIVMHMQGTPQTMQKNPHYDHVVLDVDRFFMERIERAEKIGLGREEIILDVGIGFGKTLEHNLMLLKHMKHFTHFGCEVLIGASRKSMIHKIDPAPVEERLPGTLAIHLESIRRGASIVRCHDVKEHRQAIRVFEAIEEGEIL